MFECLLIYPNNNISRSTWVYEKTKASIQVIKRKLKKIMIRTFKIIYIYFHNCLYISVNTKKLHKRDQ